VRSQMRNLDSSSWRYSFLRARERRWLSRILARSEGLGSVIVGIGRPSVWVAGVLSMEQYRKSRGRSWGRLLEVSLPEG
jgi:hypothetical protein